MTKFETIPTEQEILSVEDKWSINSDIQSEEMPEIEEEVIEENIEEIEELNEVNEAPRAEIIEEYRITTKLNCRENPSLDAKVVKVYEAGTIVIVEEEENGWFKYNEGWSLKQYMEKI